MIANPLSDSEVAISIYKMFKSLDILSRNITVFFPGFHPYVHEDYSDKKIGDVKGDYIAHNKVNNMDYHGNYPVFYTYCDSVGHIYFNDADFAKFIIDLENKTENFEYGGSPQLVLIPSTKGDIIYEKLKSYDLEPLYNYQANKCQKVEEFLVSILKLLQNDIKKSSLELITKINNIYSDKLKNNNIERLPNTVTIQLDDRILDYMKWRKSDEVFFISYSTKDEYHAYALKTLIEKHGSQVWIAPDGIPDGSDYACAIPAALRISSRVIVLLSHNSANSTWVRREIAKAISNHKKIDGILLDEFTMDDLKQYDHFDFFFEGIQIKYSINDLFEDKYILNNWLRE